MTTTRETVVRITPGEWLTSTDYQDRVLRRVRDTINMGATTRLRIGRRPSTYVLERDDDTQCWTAELDDDVEIGVVLVGLIGRLVGLST